MAIGESGETKKRRVWKAAYFVVGWVAGCITGHSAENRTACSGYCGGPVNSPGLACLLVLVRVL